MPLIKLRSSSINNSVDLKGTPTASGLSNIATTQMVHQEISNIVGAAPKILEKLGKIAQSLSKDKKNC